ncbi:MAG: hypothetical protein KKF44_00180 [Nanoarchaeota archaeon]|nr:hypothetical protein [Nanoarchaeota archaeon]
MKKKAIVWGHVLDIILFAIALVLALNLCSTTYNVIFGPKSEGPLNALSEVQQAIQHLDPDFNEISKDIMINTEDYRIIGFDKEDIFSCPDKDKGCICLCQKEDCSDLESGNDLVKYCKIINYHIKDHFQISTNDEFKTYRILLIEYPNDNEYWVALENG